MVYIHWLTYLIYIVVTVSAIVAVLMDHRQPAKTVAWIMALIFLPVIGIVLYFFFGQNTRRERYLSEHNIDLLTKSSVLEFVEQKNLYVPETHRSLINLFTNRSWALPFKDNATDIYTDGYGYFHSLLREIAGARHHIHLDTYIFEDDPLGNLVADALMDKARDGVEVRVIYDDVGCWNVDNRFFDRMQEAGIEVYPFMPVRFPAFTSKVNYRNHRKLCVIDGRVAFIGGMNIAMRYIKGTGSQPWRDTHLRIEGNAVYGVQRAFMVDWCFVSGTLITDRCYYPELKGAPENNCLMQVVTDSPFSEWPDIMQGYVRILLEARRYVYMETPYFLPTEPVMFAMRIAGLAGVDVRIMIPMHAAARFVEWASRSYVSEIVESGVKVYLYKAGFNHSKLLVCDDALASCGSANVDFRSFENNFEANVFIYDEATALRLKKVFMDDVEQCVPIEDAMNYIRIPYLQRLWESVVRLLSPLL